MKLHEYQAKSILSDYGVPVPEGGVASSPRSVAEIAKRFGSNVVIKAQVHAGGRGKAGGVKVVSSPREAEAFAKLILGKNLVTIQTGPEGVPVHAVLVEEAASIERELYLAVLVDGGTKSIVLIASESGGMEIEEVAEKTPEKILRVKINPALGLQPYQARKISYFLNCDDTQMRAASGLISNLYRVFTDNDATMVEINPLVITNDGQMLAVDAKLTLEDDALFRHTNFADFHDPDQEDPVEVRAREAGLSYVQLDGNVGCMVNGAGLAMATMDVAVAAGAKPANFLDVGGGADDTKVAEATRILLQSTSVEVILVNIFGGILRCDVVARGLMMGAESAGRNPLPMVVRMLGANAEEGQQLLKGSNLDVTLVRDLGQAADAVKQLV